LRDPFFKKIFFRPRNIPLHSHPEHSHLELAKEFAQLLIAPVTTNTSKKKTSTSKIRQDCENSWHTPALNGSMHRNNKECSKASYPFSSFFHRIGELYHFISCKQNHIKTMWKPNV